MATKSSGRSIGLRKGVVVGESSDVTMPAALRARMPSWMTCHGEAKKRRDDMCDTLSRISRRNPKTHTLSTSCEPQTGSTGSPNVSAAHVHAQVEYAQPAQPLQSVHSAWPRRVADCPVFATESALQSVMDVGLGAEKPILECAIGLGMSRRPHERTAAPEQQQQQQHGEGAAERGGGGEGTEHRCEGEHRTGQRRPARVETERRGEIGLGDRGDEADEVDQHEGQQEDARDGGREQVDRACEQDELHSCPRERECAERSCCKRAEARPARVARDGLQHPRRAEQVGERRGERRTRHSGVAERRMYGALHHCGEHVEVGQQHVALHRGGEGEHERGVDDKDEDERAKRAAHDGARGRAEVGREVGAREKPSKAGEGEGEEQCGREPLRSPARQGRGRPRVVGEGLGRELCQS
eukprot:scaffold639_cov65-Phaeocystis_antarctica.AAC.4